MLFGHERLWAFRLLSALAGGAMVFLTGLLSWALGGGWRAQIIAMIGILAAIIYLPLDGYLSMNSFEPVFWMTSMLAMILLARGAPGWWWVVFGIAAGLGIENKVSEVFFLAALLLALLLTPQRKLLRSRYCAMGVAILVALVMPNFLWQVHYHFPTLQWLQRVRLLHKDIVLKPIPFMIQQFMVLNPTTILLWGPGVIWLCVTRSARPFRFVGITYLIFLPLMIALHAKDYYLAPIYPVYFAAGGVEWAMTLHRTIERRLVVPLLLTVQCVVAAVFGSLIIPVLSPETYFAYQRHAGLTIPESEHLGKLELPQYLADMLGWKEMAAQIAVAYNALPPATRAHTGVFCGNYGEAGAIDVFGPQYGLPQALSGHQNYWLWGWHGESMQSMLVIGQSREDVERAYTDVREVGRTNVPHAMPQEDHLPIWLATGLRKPPEQLWPEVKNWY